MPTRSRTSAIKQRKPQHHPSTGTCWWRTADMQEEPKQPHAMARAGMCAHMQASWFNLNKDVCSRSRRSRVLACPTCVLGSCMHPASASNRQSAVVHKPFLLLPEKQPISQLKHTTDRYRLTSKYNTCNMRSYRGRLVAESTPGVHTFLTLCHNNLCDSCMTTSSESKDGKQQHMSLMVSSGSCSSMYIIRNTSTSEQGLCHRANTTLRHLLTACQTAAMPTPSNNLAAAQLAGL